MKKITLILLLMFKFFPTALGGRRALRLPIGTPASSKWITSILIVVSFWMTSVRFGQVHMREFLSNFVFGTHNAQSLLGKEFYLKEIRRIGCGVIQALS
jgi:hypothetical protein